MAGEGGADDDVPAHLECAICMKLLLEPVSVPCGHTFCQVCLRRSLGYRGLCAVCRAPVPNGTNVNILIRSVIADQYPRALARRLQEQEEELRQGEEEAEVARQREVRPAAAAAAAAGPDQPAIFPLLRHTEPVLPGARLELELFTYAHLTLLQYALQGGRRIVVFGPAVGGTDEDIGVCMEITGTELLGPPVQAGEAAEPGQRPSRVRLTGRFRIRLQEPPQVQEEGFELGRCEVFFDTPLALADLLLTPAPAPGPEGESNEAQPAELTTAQVATAAMQLVERQLVSLGEGGRYTFNAHIGEPPPALRAGPAGSTSSAALETVSFWLLHAIVTTSADRRRWLASTDTSGRLQHCYARLKAAGTRPVLNLPGAQSWMHPGQSPLASLALLLMILAALIAKAMGLLERSSWKEKRSAIEDFLFR